MLARSNFGLVAAALGAYALSAAGNAAAQDLVPGFLGNQGPKNLDATTTKNVSSTELKGSVGFGVNGTLPNFGQIQSGCGFTWNETQYGGGFNGATLIDGKPKNGLGGGYTFNETNLDVGAGISAFNLTTNFHINIAQDGTTTIVFDASAGEMDCKKSDGLVPGNKGMTCKVKGKPSTTSGTPKPDDKTPSTTTGTPKPDDKTPSTTTGTPKPDDKTPSTSSGTPKPDDKSPSMTNGTPTPDDKASSTTNGTPMPDDKTDGKKDDSYTPTSDDNGQKQPSPAPPKARRMVPVFFSERNA